jgi:pectate lyase-like protein
MTHKTTICVSAMTAVALGLLTTACDNNPSGDDPIACEGTVPDHASLCPGDDVGLTAPTTNVAVESCTTALLCEHQCNSGYYLENNECVFDQDATPICEATGAAQCYYIAPDGDDLNDGTLTAPFASTNPIIDTIAPGDFIYFRGGTYGEAAKGQIVNYADWLPDYYAVAYIRQSGEEGSPITFKAYPGELPVLDLYLVNPECDPQSLDDCARDAFHVRGADYIRISGFEIVHGSIVVGGNSRYTWIEDNHIHDLLTDRDNNGLIMLYFTQFAYIRNNHLHDTYSRSIPDGSDGWMLNETKDHHDAQHNGCITTLSGDIYVGYDHETSGPFEFTGNNIHDCPVHLFIKNPQGQMVNGDGVNIWVKDNFFHGAGRLGQHVNAANMLFENNLFKDIPGISQMGTDEYYDEDNNLSMINEISTRNMEFRNNVFSLTPSIVNMWGQGFLLANGVFSQEPEDKFKFYNNVVVIESTAATPGEMGWNQAGYIFSNSYGGQIDTDPTVSKTLSRIDSQNNCFINSEGDNIAFLKHWFNGSETITGYSHSDAQTLYGINGAGDLFPSDTNPATHFTDPGNNDYSILPGSPCSGITNIGLSDPTLFTN